MFARKLTLLPRPLAVLLALLLVFWATLGCTVLRGIGPVEPFVGQYFETIKNKDFDKAMAFYGEEMFKASSPSLTRERWRATLPRVQQKLGDLASYKLIKGAVRENANVGIGLPQSGTYYSLSYEVAYATSSAGEELVIFSPSGASASDLRIVGHRINSPDLLD